MSIDIEKIRNDTPGCKDVIHFNNAGASLSPKIVLGSVFDYLNKEALIGGYELFDQKQNEISQFYSLAARLINASSSEIAFTQNASYAWTMGICAVQFNKGDRVLTTESGYGSNYLNLLHLQKKYHFDIEVIPSDSSGQVCLESLEKAIDSKVRVVSLCHIPTNSGLINPVLEASKIIKQSNALFFLDATQSCGQMPLDVKEIGCDLLCATGRKFLRGPRGTGFLYVNKDSLYQMEPFYIDIHSAKWLSSTEYKIADSALKFETWEESSALKLGLAKAIDYALSIGLDVIWTRIQHLSNLLREGLSSIKKVTLQDPGKHKCGIVTFSVQGYDPEKLVKDLHSEGINTNVAYKENALLDMEKRNIAAVQRASIHYYNTEDEVAMFIDKMNKLTC